MSSGNTTTPADPSARISSAPVATHTIGVVLCQCLPEPHREGEVALLDPATRRPLCIGRTGAHFCQQRPGAMIDHGPLTGTCISAEQLELTSEGEGARVRNIGNAPVFVDGSSLRKDTSVFVLPGAVIEVLGHCILLVVRRPLSIPPPHRMLLPLHPFGEVDSMGFGGESPEAWQQREDAVMAANAGRHVFVTGDTGTGKYVVARAIHDKSFRAQGPFLALNCPDLSSEIAALGLFGGRANWPNPGTPETVGYFEAAKGGTLLLDEIGEISAAMQSKLLGALERGYTRMGETKLQETRCIVVLATNRGEGGVKEDVRMRLGVTVPCPSLAERREDIMQIARHLLQVRAEKDTNFRRDFVKTDASGREYVEMDARLIDGLLRGPLRGNVRELDNILGMSIDAARGVPPLRWPARLTAPKLATLDIREEEPYANARDLLSGLARRHDDVVAVEAPFGSAEGPDCSQDLLLQTLVATNWNHTQAAARLKITRDKVYRLRAKYGIERPD